MKSVVILIVVLVIAGGTWWFTGARDDESNSAIESTTEYASDAGESKTLAIEEASESPDSDDTAMTVIETDSTELDETETVEDASSSESSPFAVVGTEKEQVSEPAAVAQTQSELPDAEEITNVVEGTQRSLEPIEVPSSYPVTDAAKYFIPKEERGPGRLGGPPPLNFPGGPSDPNRDTNQGGLLQPPAAPGQ